MSEEALPASTTEEAEAWSPASRTRLWRISGIATPGGVFLSDGQVRSGSFLGLALSMVILALLYGVATIFLYVLLWGIGPHVRAPIIALFCAATLPQEVPLEPLWRMGFEAVRFLIFLSLLRLTPLTGYHAAEHMTVHALETGQDLTEENVSRLPRVHGRCGTGLLAGIIPALILLPLTDYLWGWPVIAAALVLGWLVRYPVGAVLQFVFTTRPPTRKELRAGIERGQDLLEKSRQAPARRVGRLESLYNRGVVQIAAVVAALVLFQWLFVPWFAERYFIWLDFGRV